MIVLHIRSNHKINTLGFYLIRGFRIKYYFDFQNYWYLKFFVIDLKMEVTQENTSKGYKRGNTLLKHFCKKKTY